MNQPLLDENSLIFLLVDVVVLRWIAQALALITFGLFVVGIMLWVGAQFFKNIVYQDNGTAFLVGAFRFLISTLIVGHMAGIWL